MLVHIFGQACTMHEINNVCKKNNIKIIEDCAQSFGATFNKKFTGAFGDLGVSFLKNLAVMVMVGSLLLIMIKAKFLKMLRNHGGLERNKHLYVGYNSRLDEVQAQFYLLS